MARPIRFATMALTIGAALARPPGTVAQVSPAQPSSGPAAVRGGPAWRALVGNTVSGRTPDGPYLEFYRNDGTVVHVDRDGKDVGRWVLKDPTVCFTYPDDDEEDCRTVEIEGTHGAFLDPDGARYRFDILPGNPNGL